MLDVDYNTSNVIAVVNPLEKMLVFADASTTNAANGSNPFAVLPLLLDGLASVLARYTFVLHSSRAADGVPDLADPARHRLRLAAGRATGCAAGAGADGGRDR